MSSTSPVQLVVSWIALLGICSYFVSCIQKKSTREDWWGNGKFTVKVDNLIDGGKRSNPQNYQQQLPNPYNTPLPSAPVQSSGFFQVPGTYASTLPPRIIPEGLSGQVSYNLPTLNQMAVDPANPLSIARCVQTPAPASVESFDYGNYGKNLPSTVAQSDRLQQQDQSSLIASSTLPVPSMVRTHQEQTSSVPTNTPTVSYDRFIVANLNRQRGHGDWIRGDLFINPILPNTDVNSPIWFRPSQGTEVLNTGAMAVLGGAYNDTNRQTCNLAMHGSGGSINTMAGVAWARPESTPVGAQIAQNAQNIAASKGIGSISLGDAQVSTYA